MTVSSTAPTKFEFVSNGGLTYIIGLRIRAKEDIIIFDGSTLVSDSHYSVSAIETNQFTLNFSSGEEPANLKNCVVFQKYILEQENDFISGQTLTAETFNEILDDLVIMFKDIEDRDIQFSFKFRESDWYAIDQLGLEATQIPAPTAEKNLVLVWDEDHFAWEEEPGTSRLREELANGSGASDSGATMVSVFDYWTDPNTMTTVQLALEGLSTYITKASGGDLMMNGTLVHIEATNITLDGDKTTIKTPVIEFDGTKLTMSDSDPLALPQDVATDPYVAAQVHHVATRGWVENQHGSSSAFVSYLENVLTLDTAGNGTDVEWGGDGNSGSIKNMSFNYGQYFGGGVTFSVGAGQTHQEVMTLGYDTTVALPQVAPAGGYSSQRAYEVATMGFVVNSLLGGKEGFVKENTASAAQSASAADPDKFYYYLEP